MRQGSDLSSLASRGSAIHLVGIGGAGMSGLALLLQARGAKVSGCDRQKSEATADLEGHGIVVYSGHDPDHVADQAAIVHTAAVPEDHPELRAARTAGLPVLKRSLALAEIANAGKQVAIAGTHGKTTTTALAALALEACGVAPTALVGGRVPVWGGNALIGDGKTFVVEADEYDRSFLALRPFVAVVTSVEPEHLDTYRSQAELEAAFDEFVSRVPAGGRVIVCGDDPGASRRLAAVSDEKRLSYGLSDHVQLRAEAVTNTPECTRFSATWENRPLGEFELALRGNHNLRNALAVLGVLLALALEPRAAAPALATFTGVERRFQRLGESGGITVVDDYAHHPTEVRATLAAARQVFGERRLVVAFQPHLYSRTRAFAADFARSLAAADMVFVTAIYPARERPLPGVTADLVVRSAVEAMGSGCVVQVDTLADLVQRLRQELREGDVLLTLGAGDIGRVAHDVLAELKRSHVDA